MATITPGMLAGLRYSKSMSDNDLQNENNRKNSALFNTTIGNIQPTGIARQQESTFQSGYPFSNSDPLDNPPKQYAATKWYEGSSAIGTEQAQDAFGRLMATRGEGDPRSNARYQELLRRRDDIVADIHRIMSEIAWQEKLKARNLTQDPLWEEAKYNWIYKGDDSGIRNIRDIEVKRLDTANQQAWQSKENELNRMATENVAKMNREETKAEKARAAEVSARNAREYLDWIYKNYKTNPDNLEVIESLHSAMRKFEESAADAGKNVKEYMDAARIDEINAAIEAGLAQKAKNVKAGKIASGIDAEIKKEVEKFNASSNKMSTTQRKVKLDELKNNPKYKDYVFGKRDGKIYYQKVGK